MRDVNIDERAIVDPSAKIGNGVSIGPWSIIGPNVEIGEGTTIASHVVLKGPTIIGEHNQIFQFSSVGEDTQDLKYNGEPTRLVIGDHNVIREGVTIHRGTVQDRNETTIGNHNLLMAYVHVGRYALVHQFCRVGAHSFTGMGSAIGKDIPAYLMVAGAPGAARGINSEGLKRRDFTREEISLISKAYKIIYRQGLTVEEAVGKLHSLAEKNACEKLLPLIASLTDSTRGIIR